MSEKCYTQEIVVSCILRVAYRALTRDFDEWWPLFAIPYLYRLIHTQKD